MGLRTQGGEALLDVGTAHLVSNFDIENGEKWLTRAAEFRLIAENRAKFAATPRKLDRSACKGILMNEMFEGYLAVLAISIACMYVTQFICPDNGKPNVEPIMRWLGGCGLLLFVALSVGRLFLAEIFFWRRCLRNGEVIIGQKIESPLRNVYCAKVKAGRSWKKIRFQEVGGKPSGTNFLLLYVKKKSINENSAVLAAPLPFGLEYDAETQTFSCPNVHLSRTVIVSIALITVEIAAYFGLLLFM